MKYLHITAGILLLVFIGFQIYASYLNDVETQQYSVIEKLENFEVRSYPSAIKATTLINGEFKKSSGKGFRKLAKYIFKGNKENKRIAMTSPVWMEHGENYENMSFIMPSKYEMSALPEPNDENIVISKFKQKKFAVIQFSGFAKEEKINQKHQELLKLLSYFDYSYAEEKFFYAGYDAPFVLFNRRNEVLVAID